jgi:hypothetical protein
MKKKGFIIIAVVLSVLLNSNTWAVDEGVIGELQTDVSVTKGKLEKNEAEIQNLKGGLPAEAAERKAADADLQNQINNIALTPGPQGAQGPQGKIGPQGPAGADGADGDSLPVGANPGDLLYWDGSVWQLTPAPPVNAATPPVLTLIAGVPTWVSPNSYPNAIGNTGPAGGIVFHITDGGLHGLEAAPADQGYAPWGCYGTEIIDANWTVVGIGAQNTAAILAQCGTGTAADMAGAYTLNGYDDWFLPSKDELNLLYGQRAVVGGFANDYYWSSSQYNSIHAWTQFFSNGNQYNDGKNNLFRVRAVRAF